MTTFRVWAPAAERVRLTTGGDEHELSAAGGGWWRADVPTAAPGDDYGYLLDDDATPLPDPRSPWQPYGVHGMSRLVDHDAYEWHDSGWTGRALPGSVVYEMHVGTFTAERTFDGAIARLDHLVDLGVDLVEILPVAAFPGRHGWGYDGVHLWAVHDPYGGPDGLKRFVDACHGKGLGVVLDVVYNHLGPAGNYLGRFGPYFTGTHVTPWGDAVNLDAPGSDEVRRWIVDGALSWLRDYHLDGLRLDAVHALADERATHVLEEMAAEVDALAAHVRRPLTLIAESDLNDPRVVTPRAAGGWGVDAQWNDDFHHALHSLLTGERQGYYADFGSLAALERTLTSAYFHSGDVSTFRGRHHGRPVDRERVPGWRFLGYLQDHDQIGNRATGDRISATLSDGLLRIGAALVLTSPFTPMLFMGEEWGAATPWQFFTDHEDPDLAEAVRTGRRREFAEHGWAELDVPDPQHPSTVDQSTLDWSELEKEEHGGLLEWYRRLIALRRARPELSDPRLDRVRMAYDEQARWLVVERGRLAVAANLAQDAQTVPLDGTPRALLLASEGGFVYRDGAIDLAAESVAVVELA